MKTYLIIPLQRDGGDRAFLATETELGNLPVKMPHAEFPVGDSLSLGLVECWARCAKRLLRQIGRLSQ